MPDLSLIILAAGNSTRFDYPVKKQWLRVGNKPLWLFVAKKFDKMYDFKKIVITSSDNELFYMKRHSNNFTYVFGGDSRQDSLKNALSQIDTQYVMVTDVARACVPKKLVLNLIENYKKADIVVPALGVVDTVVYNNETIDRDDVKLIQTPQLSKRDILEKAISSTKTQYTDDSSAIKAIGGTVFYTKGDKKAKKITRYDDLSLLECLKVPKAENLVGFGFDVHQFQKDKQMVLCGVEIDSEFGFRAHSDGDVALHALIDAILGAVGAGDIGELFPDSDEQYESIDSKVLLKDVVSFTNRVGFEIVNVDITVMAEAPKLSPYKSYMQKSLSQILKIDPIRVNIKATTTEKLGFVGRKEGVAVSAVASLKIKQK